MNRQGIRVTLGVLTFAMYGSAMAIGLGELRGQLVLGDRPMLSVSVLGVEGAAPDASCFRLVKPASGDQLPWLRDADLRIRPGQPPQLLIEGRQRARDPVVQIGLQILCGHQVQREYTLLASPDEGVANAEVETVASAKPAVERSPARQAAKPVRPQASNRVRESQPAPPRSEPSLPAPARENAGDRLMLSAGEDSALRLEAVLGERMLAGEAAEAQREILRLEYRMLAALYEQASSQLAAAEKLRSMESALDELQGKTLALTERVSGQASAPTSAPQAPVQAPVPVPVAAQDESDLFSSWWFTGLLLGVLFGLAGWLFWRRRQQATDGNPDSLLAGYPEPVMDAPRADELPEKRPLDLHLESTRAGVAQSVDVELDGGAASPVPEKAAQPLPARPGDSVLSINATTLDEHFEANPVMELADIMLSFGRVKGAAQALQEYIDNNPQEALQPWIRLMDVYRMAGMREEFDAVARNLNQHFNVEVQSWEKAAAPTVDLMLDGGVATDPGGDLNKPAGIEDMPRILNSVLQMWESEDVVGYLYQLLRDNRGGQRQGFALPVVEEILFLIELKETSNRMEKEKTGSA